MYGPTDHSSPEDANKNSYSSTATSREDKVRVIQENFVRDAVLHKEEGNRMFMDKGNQDLEGAAKCYTEAAYLLKKVGFRCCWGWSRLD